MISMKILKGLRAVFDENLRIIFVNVSSGYSLEVPQCTHNLHFYGENKIICQT